MWRNAAGQSACGCRAQLPWPGLLCEESPSTGWICLKIPKATPLGQLSLAELHSMLLSTFQTCPRPLPPGNDKGVLCFSICHYSLCESLSQEPDRPGVDWQAGFGHFRGPSPNPHTSLTRVPEVCLPAGAWMRPALLICQHTLWLLPPPPFLPRQPCAYFSSHQFTSRFLLGWLHISITSHRGRLQSTSARGY